MAASSPFELGPGCRRQWLGCALCGCARFRDIDMFGMVARSWSPCHHAEAGATELSATDATRRIVDAVNAERAAESLGTIVRFRPAARIRTTKTG